MDMLRVGALFALALFGCQVAGYGPSAVGPSSAPPPSSSSSSPARPPPSDDRVVAATPDHVTVPDIENVESVEVAKQRLRDAGLTGELTVSYDPGDPAQEIVCGTQPNAGQVVQPDFEVNIAFCIKARPLAGMTVDQAKTEIARMHDVEHSRRNYRVVVVDGNCTHGTVCSVDPPAWADGFPDAITLAVGK
ncbi:MAG TPA: PASTA domain-containing protein [Kofleriaceae bacterium]|nr:PASTA domain-containing protein [Kofleriaceae bacterium]